MLVAMLVMVTVAFTTIAPLWSVTCPRTCARYAPCARRFAGSNAAPAKTTTNKESQDGLRRRTRIEPPQAGLSYYYESKLLLSFMMKVKTIRRQSATSAWGSPRAGINLRNDYGGSINGVVLHRNEGLICLVEREDRDFRTQANSCRECQEVTGVRAGHIGNASNLALPPKQRVVIKLRDAVEMDGIDRDHAAFPKASERGHHHIARRSEGHRAIEIDGWLFRFGSHPCGPQRFS